MTALVVILFLQFSEYFSYIHDAASAKNIVDGFEFYLQHKEYHNNSNIQEYLAAILFNARLPVEKKAKIFNLIANDSNLEETKLPFLNHGNSKLDHFINCSDKVDIDLAYRILHDTNDSNGTILNRILDPNDECYPEIIALYNKYKDNPEYDDILNSILEEVFSADAIILGTPSYFSDMTPELKSFIDRAGVIALGNGKLFKHKIGAGVVAQRRGGGTSIQSTLHHMFLMSEMIIPGSTYWNLGFGCEKGEVLSDEEAMQNMENLGENICWLLKKIL